MWTAIAHAREFTARVSWLGLTTEGRWPQAICMRSNNAIVKGSPYSTAERRVPELIPVLGSQPAG